jgi:hypothetical protein
MDFYAKKEMPTVIRITTVMKTIIMRTIIMADTIDLYAWYVCAVRLKKSRAKVLALF